MNHSGKLLNPRRGSWEPWFIAIWSEVQVTTRDLWLASEVEEWGQQSCGIWRYLQVDSVSTELNCRILNWCHRELFGVGKNPHIWCQKCCEGDSSMRVKEQHIGKWSFSFTNAQCLKTARKYVISYQIINFKYKEVSIVLGQKKNKFLRWHLGVLVICLQSPKSRFCRQDYLLKYAVKTKF